MPSRAETTITLTDAPEDGERTVLMDGFARVQRIAGGRFGRTSARHPRARSRYGGGRRRPAGPVLPRPPDGGTVLPAGVPAPRGLGGRILAMAEEDGRRRGCTRAVLSTLHFQAPGFYLKQGWEVAARIECEPPGHTRFYMTKNLA